MTTAAQLIFLLEGVLFASVLFIQLMKKNSSAIALYVIQSLIVVVFLTESFLRQPTFMLLAVIAVVFAVKVCVAPYFFSQLIRKHRLTFSVSTYLNTPMTLVIIAVLSSFAYSNIFSPLAALSSDHEDAIHLAIAMMLVSLFLIVNRKGALSQMIGILSLENAIVSFSFLVGLEEASWLQLGILFDIAVWIIIASVFASIVYQHFGSLNVTEMRHLKEE